MQQESEDKKLQTQNQHTLLLYNIVKQIMPQIENISTSSIGTNTCFSPKKDKLQVNKY